ncbi:MerR family transcriptional regulator [Streptomyces caniscabiei]|uniref:DNA polymerase III subunit beta family protein n=1 Tax=Streptomyces caniscabiei TaxID=2746961 RepID=UPI0029B51134|nr:MerR family transcriptional regulator [Streptomyces caniscabiei]MDX2600773.1 MerR family transcriptional regulator [Streptomyces caniscabiei]MDX2736646.1 MerR family transcriptional regulator [Streptomyces caniscabiei]MDX2777275.1 MerR family transcriptional regulator [Streptomyces caniscabiei]
MHSIGEMARDSGLGVSALRFYDRAGVLVPAWVDPVSGYRWYEPEQLEEARLLARLRRAGMPLADIRLVLAGWGGADMELVRGLLQAHLRRLELGLSDARSEFSTLRALLDHRETAPMTSLHTATARFSVPAPELAAALDAVRFAAGTDAELPMLGGILLDIEGELLRLVATDRYRMAVASARTTGHGEPRTQVVVPLPLADAMRALLTGDEPADLIVDGDRVTLEAGDRQAAGQSLGGEFPDYRRLVHLPAGRRARVATAAFRQALETGPVREGEPREQDGEPYDLSVLRVAEDGTVIVCDDGADGDDDQNNVAVNREFLLHALTAGARDELFLEVGAPTAPLAIRRPDDEHTFSLLMPVRLEG